MNTDRKQVIESFEEEIETLKNTLDTFREDVSKHRLPLHEIVRYTKTIKDVNDLMKSLKAVFF